MRKRKRDKKRKMVYRKLDNGTGTNERPREEIIRMFVSE